MFGENPLKNNKYNFFADLKAAINLDFGRDYISAASHAWAHKEYLSWINLELAATCEIIYDCFFAYEGATAINYLVESIQLSSLSNKLINETKIIPKNNNQSSILNKSFDIIYGPSAKGSLTSLANKLNSKVLSDYGTPYDCGFSSWIDFSTYTLDKISSNGGKILFDLTNVSNIQGILSGQDPYANTVTSQELRYIMNNWDRFSSSVTFCINEVEVNAPW